MNKMISQESLSDFTYVFLIFAGLVSLVGLTLVFIDKSKEKKRKISKKKK